MKHRALQKLAECNENSITALEKLFPHTSEYITPENSERLARHALILYNPTDRRGATEEADMLLEGLTHVGFDVLSHTWSHPTQLLDEMRSLLMQLVSKTSVFFIGIMTHGHDGMLRGVGDSEVPVNDVLMLINDILPQHVPMVRRNTEL